MQNRMRKLIMGLCSHTCYRLQDFHTIPGQRSAGSVPGAWMNRLPPWMHCARKRWLLRLPTSLPETATPEIVDLDWRQMCPVPMFGITQPLQEETAQLLQVAFRNNSLSRGRSVGRGIW